MALALIHDAVAALREHMDGTPAIELEPDHERMESILDLLAGYKFAYSRKVTILACCILIYLAADKHKELPLHDNDAMTRRILDGDYLTGLCYRFAAAQREWRLLAHMTSFNKRMQLMLMAGGTAALFMKELRTEIKLYMDRDCA